MRIAAAICLTMIVTGGLLPAPAQAWLHGPRNSCAIGGYAPSTPRYIVVDPTDAVRGPIAFGKTPQGQQCGPTWPAAGLPAPTYPWGWFGANPTFEHTTHYPQYNDYKQSARVRGF